MSLYEQVSTIIERAGEILLEYYDSVFDVNIKDDGSFVTTADTEVSSFLEKELLKIFPDDVVSTEENWKLGVESLKRLWLSDPLDGTKAFVERAPNFSLILSCIEDEIPIFGCIYFPLNKTILYAEKDKGCFFINKGTKKRIFFDDKIIKITDSRILCKPSHKRNKQVKDFIDKGDFKSKTEIAISGHVFKEFIESGKYDLLVLSDPFKYEFGALACLIKESGGRYLSLKGTIPSLRGNYCRINDGVVLGNKENVINFLKEYGSL
ncbi:MAG: hypothetical protein PHF46_00930 [Candidatus Gracilibacteria bacterium]|nr:hypothetical protein [Candidatus Gracilibacteria bacterium]MDD3119956.1 hypothetical protein [Candidatus Gracilibacteria bacterium]MDD4529936.1 hypothetical protein [Candidatus Gracilibacteria bacterium]